MPEKLFWTSANMQSVKENLTAQPLKKVALKRTLCVHVVIFKGDRFSQLQSKRQLHDNVA